MFYKIYILPVNLLTSLQTVDAPNIRRNPESPEFISSEINKITICSNCLRPVIQCCMYDRQNCPTKIPDVSKVVSIFFNENKFPKQNPEIDVYALI